MVSVVQLNASCVLHMQQYSAIVTSAIKATYLLTYFTNIRPEDRKEANTIS